jgi:hypothetical protein
VFVANRQPVLEDRIPIQHVESGLTKSQGNSVLR